jgi:two-component system catabolic regulation response regulator CreB
MKPKVLVVEDERAVADAIVYALATDGCQPSWVSTGGEALAFLAREDVSLVVLDVGLPDASGFDVCRDIRRRSEVPIIFLTARAEEVDRVAGLEIGADDYVVKPFSPRELSARVRAVLRRARSSGTPAGSDGPPASRDGSSTSCTSGPFVLDNQRRRVTFFGTPLDLTRYEYRLLEILLRHPGWVYSRETLMNEAWDDPSAAFDRTVDSHIKSLRAKLRAVRADCDPIATHRGEGYSLKERW